MINNRTTYVIRRLTFALILISAFTGIARANETPEKIINDYMSAWNAHDADKASSYLAENVEYLDITVGIPQKGRMAARDNVIKVFITAIPDLSWKITSTPITTADGIAFQWVFSGTNSGAWGPETPATNKMVTFEGMSFIRINDGKISYQADYYDALGFNTQLGW
jgi:steroid delta-isomerase-like uncharacterized protein